MTVVALGSAPETLRATPNHPFFVADRGWTRAGELRTGDELVGERGEPLVVGNVAIERVPVATFNFEVEEDHTYFVAERLGAAPVWVHNVCRQQTRDILDGKDYLIDPETGRVYGHAGAKHINIKLPDGRKVAIIIDPN